MIVESCVKIINAVFKSIVKKRLRGRFINLREALTLTHPEIIQDIYRAYIEAGSDIITTCTFGANGYKLKDTEYDQKEIITAAVKLAKELKPGYVALDIGPLGALIGSLGEISFDEAYHYFAQMVEIGAEAGADVLLIETVTDIYEMKAAVLAAKEHSDLPRSRISSSFSMSWLVSSR